MSFVRICWSIRVETLCWLMWARRTDDETKALLAQMARSGEIAVTRDDAGHLVVMDMKRWARGERP